LDSKPKLLDSAYIATHQSQISPPLRSCSCRFDLLLGDSRFTGDEEGHFLVTVYRNVHSRLSVKHCTLQAGFGPTQLFMALKSTLVEDPTLEKAYCFGKFAALGTNPHFFLWINLVYNWLQEYHVLPTDTMSFTRREVGKMYNIS